MSYNKMKIIDVLEKIRSNSMYLPAIQRKFVWETDKIETLFDSLMRNFPIGTFLFWKVERPELDNYVFYKFLQNYHERDKWFNEKAPAPEIRDEILGVLDGQQRLSSLYIALQGTHSSRSKGKHSHLDRSYPKKELYLNVVSHLQEDEERDNKYQFKFLTSEEAAPDSKSIWVNVKDLIKEKVPKFDKYFDVEILKHKNICPLLTEGDNKYSVIEVLHLFHRNVYEKELINYFLLDDPDIENVLKIFIRVNQAGTILSKSDLLFSTIVASWESGREKIEELQQSINRIGDGYSFSNDFLMRCALMLLDLPIRYKVSSFKAENVEKIKTQWSLLEESVVKTVELVHEFGVIDQTLRSKNAIIPLIYYVMKGGILNVETKKEMKKFLICSLLKNVYGAHGDTLLSAMQVGMRTSVFEGDKLSHYILSSNVFSFEWAASKLPREKSVRLTSEDIEEMLEYEKGPDSNLVLALIVEGVNFAHSKFHQDHLNPYSAFYQSKLRGLGVPEEKISRFQSMANQLPNLTLLEGGVNQSKNDKVLEKYIVGLGTNVDSWKMFHAIPNCSYSIIDFENFYESRKALLRNRIANLFS
ncbi:MAG: DUF262 domain-containing protein [Fibrobacterota bacterium]|nr:MAG: DUF262 domain-containing protein [Fibrobacterota bacterium]